MSVSRVKLSTIEEKLKWLNNNKHLWKNITIDKQQHLKIVKEMKKAGLISLTTYPIDVRVENYIKLLKASRPSLTTTK